MERPSPGRVRAHKETQPFTRLYIDRVLVRPMVTVSVLQLAPQAVEMNRMTHHRVVHQNDAHPLPKLHPHRFGLRELLAVESPYEPLHVAGQMKLDVPVWRTRVDAAVARAQIGVSQDLPAVV